METQRETLMTSSGDRALEMTPFNSSSRETATNPEVGFMGLCKSMEITKLIWLRCNGWGRSRNSM
jgi:hypothetical protein